MAKSRLQMTELERAEADRDEARQEALDLRAALAGFVAAAENTKLEMYRCGYCFYMFEGRPKRWQCPKCGDTALKHLIFADGINEALERARKVTNPKPSPLARENPEVVEVLKAMGYDEAAIERRLSELHGQM